MTAYQPFPTGEQDRDPTAVMGRRILAWVIDLLLFLAVTVALFAAFAEYVEVPSDLVVDACEVLREEADDEAAGCMLIGDRAYITSASETGIQTLASIGYLIFFVVIQGVTGGSPGKLLTGVRVVDASGRRAGVAKSFGRTVLWVIDGAPWFVPLVGFIVGLTSTGHRRVGDMAAGTYVVRSSHVGKPVTPHGTAPEGADWTTAPPPQASASPPPSGYGLPSAPPTAPPPGTTAPSISGVPAETPAPPPISGGPSDDQGPSSAPPFTSPWTPEAHGPQDEAAGPVDLSTPHVGADPDWSSAPELHVEPPAELREQPPTEPEPTEWQAPSATEAAATWEPPTTPSETEPRPFTAPGADPAPGPGTTPPQPSPAPPPQWDPARNTYIQWDPSQQAWLQWDTGAERWKPIDT